MTGVQTCALPILSWKRLDKLSDVYKVGDHIKSVVVSLDEAKRNVKLSIKKLEEDPWATVANEFKIDDEIEGTVTKVLPYGAFVEIKPGVEGLVHISDFSWTKKKVNVAEYVKEEEKVKVRITDLHPEERQPEHDAAAVPRHAQARLCHPLQKDEGRGHCGSQEILRETLPLARRFQVQ